MAARVWPSWFDRGDQTQESVAPTMVLSTVAPSGPFLFVLNVRFWRALCKGGVSQWVRISPGDFAPAGSNRSSHGGNEVAEASGVEGH